MEPLDVQGVRLATVAPGTKVLIHWKDVPAFEDSWESTDVIATQFPSFNLEDKVALWAASNVRLPIQLT